jgi:hypothetical protein
MTVSALVMVGSLAGCSGGSGNNPPGGGGTQPPAALSCAVAPAAMVNAALGTNVGDPEQQVVGHGVMCHYKPVPDARGNVVLRIQTDTTRALFDQGRATSPPTRAPSPQRR